LHGQRRTTIMPTQTPPLITEANAWKGSDFANDARWDIELNARQIAELESAANACIARGLREIEPELLDLVRSLRGSRWQLFVKIQLPGALPYIFSGMKVASILAVAGAVVGEFLGSDTGLGYLMLQVQVTLDTPAMFMAVILITLLGMLLYGFVLLLERWLVVRDARVS